MMKKMTGRNKLPFNVTFNFYALFMSGNSPSVRDSGHTVSLHNVARIASAKALSRCLRRATMGNSDKSLRRKKTDRAIRNVSICGMFRSKIGS